MWQKRPPINIFYLYRNGKMGCQKETLSIFTLECICCRIGPLSNFHFQEKILNKWPHVAYRKKLTFFFYNLPKKYELMSSKLRPQGEVKNGSWKKTPVYWKVSFLFAWFHKSNIGPLSFKKLENVISIISSSLPTSVGLTFC